MKINKAKSIDAYEITELTLRSKNYWNYGKEQIEAWREELTITPEYINKNQVFKIINENSLLGFYAYQPIDSKKVKLNYLFIEPKFIGQGLGKILMNDFLKRIEQNGFEKVTLDADPNAESFYQSFGFKVTGQLKSSIKDRFLPIMELNLKLTHNI